MAYNMREICPVVFTGFFAALILTPIARMAALKWKILDCPGERKMHTRAIPLLGGVAVFFAFIIPLARYFSAFPRMKDIILPASLVLAIGLIDDIKKLPAIIRLGGQILAAVILVIQGQVLTFFPPSWWGRGAAILFTVLWVVGITNGFNFLDGLDGLAGGVAAIVCSSFLVIALRTDQTILAFFCAACLGGILGFLPYNFHPGKIFLGDAGSTFLGFILASLALLGGWAENNPLVALGTPLIVMGVIVFDLIYITVSRIYQGKVRSFTEWINYTGRDHLHHRFIRLGFSHRQAVLAIYLIGIFLGIGGIVLNGVDPDWTFLIMSQGVLLFLLITIIMNVGHRTIGEA